LHGLQPVFSEDSEDGEAEDSIAIGAASEKTPAAAASQKVGRNDPCPCGSGKKYKKCCGA
jgi:uncharacterized protein YecA (UPF0149 family)